MCTMNGNHQDAPRTTVPTLAPVNITTITAEEIDRWLCECGNTPHGDGFDFVDRHGNSVDPTPEQWPEPLYMCNNCGLVMDAATVDITAHTVAVIGRIAR
ncbi:hypothetical protein CF165_47025 [Amycolatopsis vastitatis]|uniref:Uncharacterized protein n=2 Tax=Amycolatopsis vastitatis TaxID=1905142 RepID=A0A229SLE2_9PSEU|nr:hypothetical protein CF165_47025 [Amycolatopsis vastitatis]